MQKSKWWKYVVGVLLCAGCCAAPLLLGLTGTVAIGAFMSKGLELIACLSLFFFGFILFQKYRKSSQKCEKQCSTNCGCKTAS